jgi:hypothetical protein
MLTLFRMPSSTFTDICYELDEKEDVGSAGVITVGSKECQTSKWWWRAVAGIAFGELVPQATWEWLQQ